MKHLRKLSLGIALMALTPIAAMADIITLEFDDEISRWIALDGFAGSTPYSEDGFVVDGTGSGNALGFGDTWCGPPCPRNGTNALRVSRDTTVISIVEENGGLFDVLSFDGAEFFAGLTNTWAWSIRLTGIYDGGGSVTEDFALDWITDGEIGGIVDFENFIVSADFTDLVELEITGVGGSSNYFSVDNVVLEVSVPEPGTLALFGLGLAGLGLARRRSKA